MCKYMSIIWRIIGVVSIILGIIGKIRRKEISESIIGRFWSIIDLSLKSSSYFKIAWTLKV